MIDALITVGAGAVSGGVAGGVVAWRARRRYHQPVVPALPPPAAAQPSNDGLDQVATAWAEAHGQPAAAPLVANKLRLAQRLVAQRSGRWSR